jgi:hypothetical protein
MFFGGIFQVFQDTNGFCALLRALIMFLGPAVCLKVQVQVQALVEKKRLGQCTLYIAFNGRRSGCETASVLIVSRVNLCTDSP